MAASPRTSWKGAITVGMVSVPVTLAPAHVEKREQGLKEVCGCHGKPLLRDHRCAETQKKPDVPKKKGVEKPDGSWHVFTEAEISMIEDKSSSKELAVEDVQPLDELPLAYATGAKYLRADDKVAGSEIPYATIARALQKSGYGLVVKWCTSTKQRPCVIRELDGMLVMQVLPTADEIREPGDKENAHKHTAIKSAQVDMAVTLLDTMKSEEFQFDDLTDDAMLIRQELVDKVLDGEDFGIEDSDEKDSEPVPDLMDTLTASIEANKKEKV